MNVYTALLLLICLSDLILAKWGLQQVWFPVAIFDAIVYTDRTWVSISIYTVSTRIGSPE